MSASSETDANERRPDASTARRLVLEQHLALRRLLNARIAEARTSIADNPARRESLRTLIEMMRQLFVQHLADEEALIVPILEDDLPLGPLRAESLRDEHSRQLQELDTLCAWPATSDDGDLVERFDSLATALLDDITHEERDLLTPDIVRDDCVVVDQSSG